MTTREEQLTAALRDAAAHIERQRGLFEDLLQLFSVQCVSIEARYNRARGEVRAVRKACEELGISYERVTLTSPSGNLLRKPSLVQERERLVMHLRRPNATPYGPMSFPEIARGMRLQSHSALVEAEQRAARKLQRTRSVA